MANFTTPPVWYGKQQKKVDMFSGYNSQTAINIGTNNNNNEHDNTISIGYNVQNAPYSIGIGFGCTAYGYNSIAIGFGAEVALTENNKVQLLGNDVENAELYVGNKKVLFDEIKDNNVTILGSAVGSNGIAIGYNSLAQYGSVAIGYDAKSLSNKQVRLLGNDVENAELYVGNTKMASENYVNNSINTSVSTNKSYINILKGRVNDIIDQLATRFSATNIRDMLIKDTEIPQ